MERRLLISLKGFALPIILGLSSIASAQTPEPAAGNPAINTTPTPSNSNGVTSGKTGGDQSNSNATAIPSDKPQTIASPSSEASIPKGSNPNSGTGNMAAGSGATAPAESTDNPMGSQTAKIPENSDMPAGAAPNAPTNNSSSMPQGRGRYAAPPTDPK